MGSRHAGEGPRMRGGWDTHQKGGAERMLEKPKGVGGSQELLKSWCELWRVAPGFQRLVRPLETRGTNEGLSVAGLAAAAPTRQGETSTAAPGLWQHRAWGAGHCITHSLPFSLSQCGRRERKGVKWGESGF